MPFQYLDASTLNVGPHVSDAFTAIPVPPLDTVYGVQKYLSPWGLRATNTFQSAGSGHFPFNLIMFVPIKVDTTSTYDRIGFGLTSASSIGAETWTYNLGLYDDNGGYPGDLLTDFGSIAITSSSAAGNKLITISQQLTANTLYWLAIGGSRTNSGSQPYSVTPFFASIVGDFINYRKSGTYSPASTSTTGIGWVEQLSSYAGTLPTSAASSWTGNSGSCGIVPTVGLRRSA